MKKWIYRILTCMMFVWALFPFSAAAEVKDSASIKVSENTAEISLRLPEGKHEEITSLRIRLLVTVQEGKLELTEDSLELSDFMKSQVQKIFVEKNQPDGQYEVDVILSGDEDIFAEVKKEGVSSSEIVLGTLLAECQDKSVGLVADVSIEDDCYTIVNGAGTEKEIRVEPVSAQIKINPDLSQLGRPEEGQEQPDDSSNTEGQEQPDDSSNTEGQEQPDDSSDTEDQEQTSPNPPDDSSDTEGQEQTSPNPPDDSSDVTDKPLGGDDKPVEDTKKPDTGKVESSEDTSKDSEDTSKDPSKDSDNGKLPDTKPAGTTTVTPTPTVTVTPDPTKAPTVTPTPTLTKDVEKEEFSTKTKPSLKVKCKNGSRKASLSWKKVKGAEGYQVYGYNRNTKKYKKLADIKNGNTLKFKTKNLKAASKHKFKIRAYAFDQNGKKVYGKYSKVTSVVTAPVKAVLKKVVSTEEGCVNLSWKKVSRASGYQIYRSDKKGGKYTKAATVKNEKNLSQVLDGLTSGKTYYFKVRAYKNIGKSKRIYGKLSNVKSVTIS